MLHSHAGTHRGSAPRALSPDDRRHHVHGQSAALSLGKIRHSRKPAGGGCLSKSYTANPVRRSDSDERAGGRCSRRTLRRPTATKAARMKHNARNHFAALSSELVLESKNGWHRRLSRVLDLEGAPRPTGTTGDFP